MGADLDLQPFLVGEVFVFFHQHALRHVEGEMVVCRDAVEVVSWGSEMLVVDRARCEAILDLR